MLSEEESALVFSQLEQIAVQHRLEWLVEAVRQDLANGKESEQEFSKLSAPKTQSERTLFAMDSIEEEVSVSRSAHGLKKITVTEEYSNQERLKIFINALEAIVIGLTESLRETTKDLHKADPEMKIEFASDSEDDDQFFVSRTDLPSSEKIENLRHALRELKELA